MRSPRRTRRRAAALVLALVALLTFGGASMTVAQFKARVADMQPVERKALKAWLTHLAFQAWLDGLREGGFYDPLQCGGDLPPCHVMQRESGGNPLAVFPGHASPQSPGADPYHNASGKWQFMPGTWNGYMGYPYAAAAPVRIQDAKAREVWANGAGASHWAMTV